MLSHCARAPPPEPAPPSAPNRDPAALSSPCLLLARPLKSKIVVMRMRRDTP